MNTPIVESWTLDTNKDLVDKVFGELMRAKPEVANKFLRLTLREIAIRIPQRQAHSTFARFIDQQGRRYAAGAARGKRYL